MPLIRDRCICLRKTEYSETSQVVTLLSREHGVFRAIAKGAHRRTKAGASKFDGGMDFLEVGEAVFTFDPARELSTLTEWTLRDGHLGLRQDLRGLYLALYAGELVDRLLEQHDPHPELFDRLEAVVPELATDRREQAFLAFELDLLRATGYLPELHQCAACGRPSTAGATVVGPAATGEPTPVGSPSGTQPVAAAAPTIAGDRPPADRPIPGYISANLGGIVCPTCEGAVPDRQGIDGRLLRLVRGFLRVSAEAGPGGVADLPPLARRHTDPINRVLLDHVQHTLGRPMSMGKWVLP